MACAVLTPERWRKFLENRLAPDEQAALRAHLQTDCVPCEEFLTGLGLNEVDETLFQLWEALALPAESAPQMTETEFNRIFQKVKAALASGPGGTATGPGIIPVKYRPRSFSFRPAWTFLGTGLLILMIGFLWVERGHIIEPPPPYDRDMKGNPVPLPLSLHLQFSVKRQAPGKEATVEPGIIGGRYRNTDTLFFRYDTHEKGYLYLVNIDSTGKTTFLYPGLAVAPVVEPGSHDLERDGTLLGLPLGDASGRLTIVGVLSQTPLDFGRDLLPEIQKKAYPLFPGRSDLAVDLVYLEVTEK
jgi:hypothetical protein